jgi:hypothetical protein
MTSLNSRTVHSGICPSILPSRKSPTVKLIDYDTLNAGVTSMDHLNSTINSCVVLPEIYISSSTPHSLSLILILGHDSVVWHQTMSMSGEAGFNSLSTLSEEADCNNTTYIFNEGGREGDIPRTME